METKEAWDTGRPIFSRLPGVYQENEVADWLTVFFDELLVGAKAQVDGIPRQLDPLLCDDVWLDRINLIFGFSDEYWDRAWPEASKRVLLDGAYTEIWNKRGTRASLSYVLSALNIEHTIWEGSSFILGTSQLDINTLGDGSWRYKILLPRRYAFNGFEFQLTRKINRLFGNLWCESEVIYVDQLIIS
ncbi:phage tail protein [Anabaena sp. CCY 9402-a]|uniref:phage tail protein n=1 Tax=Anabaena sp. CCY 9402-a TaxID=3103867 RepID=UPI0039C731BE